MLNFIDLAKELGYKSSQSVSRPLVKYADDPKLKSYVIRNDAGKVIGLDEDGLDVFRRFKADMPHKRSSSKRSHKQKQIDALNEQLKTITAELNDIKNKYYVLLKESEKMKDFEKELEFYKKNASFLVKLKLLTYKK